MAGMGSPARFGDSSAGAHGICGRVMAQCSTDGRWSESLVSFFWCGIAAGAGDQ
jgi:hypothetical protein